MYDYILSHIRTQYTICYLHRRRVRAGGAGVGAGTGATPAAL